MNPSNTSPNNPSRRLHLHSMQREPRRPGESTDYPRGYIEQLARTFSDRRTGGQLSPRRRSRPSPAAGLG